MRIPARLHLWPWSCVAANETKDLTGGEVSFDFYGSPVISIVRGAYPVLPSRHERFHSLGSVFQAFDSRDCQLFETPHGTISGDANKTGISIHSRDCIDIVRLSPKGVVARDDGLDEQGRPKDSPLARVVLQWSSFFDQLLDQARRKGSDNERLEWKAVRSYLERLKKEAGEPFRAVIVDIAEIMHRSLPEIVRAARRVLLRERRLLPAGRVEETDGACLHWYIRQPGRTMAEKAGPRQRLLAVARQETRNLHENRILKDFLGRCTGEGRRYVANAVDENPAFRQAKTVQTVQALATLCAQLAADRQLEDVSEPNPATPPNYVLLNDIRYRRVWYWYQRLLRQEQEKDRFWDWQARTWADIARLLASVAVVTHFQQVWKGFRLSPLYEGALRVKSEQSLGCRTGAGSETGPLLVEWLKDGKPVKQSVLEIVHPEQAEHHPIACRLGATGGHLYLVLRPFHGKESPRVLIVWAAHTAASKGVPSWKQIHESAATALDRHQGALDMARVSPSPVLRGLVICSDANTDEPDIEPPGGGGKSVLISVPTDPKKWMAAVEWIALGVDEMLEK